MKNLLLIIFLTIISASCVYDKNRGLMYYVVNKSEYNICVESKLKLYDSTIVVNISTKDTMLLYISATRGNNFEDYDMDYFKKDLTINKIDCKNNAILDSIDFKIDAEKKYIKDAEYEYKVPCVYVYFK